MIIQLVIECTFPATKNQCLSKITHAWFFQPIPEKRQYHRYNHSLMALLVFVRIQNILRLTVVFI